MVLYIILGILGIFIVLAVVNYRKMKNMPMPEDDKNIVKLTSGNFKKNTSSGLVLVDFWASWCGPCKMIAPTLNSIAQTESDKVQVAKVNIDEEKQLATQFNIRSIPTLLFFKDGKEVKRISGIKSKKFIVSQINELK